MKLLLRLTLGLLLLASPSLAVDRPHIIVMMADDMGYECVSANGSEMYETPHIDALAASGMRFTNAHSQPICTPSRVQIMTGIYNNRNYVKFGLLDPEVTTFGNLLREAGYQTVVAGKWQLQGGYEGVKNFGFDRHCLWQLNRRPSRYPNPGLEIDGEEKDFKDGGFGPHVVGEYVGDYLAEHKDDEEPIFVYYPMIEPHWPFVPTPGSKDWDPTMWRDTKNEPGGYKDQKYWDGMVRMTDASVGRVVAKLDELGIREKTLLIFTCDNGTYTGVKSTLNGSDYPGGKGSTPDNGTHVPFVASWPGTIEAGKVSEALVDLSDVLPTICEAGKVKVPAKLGVDGTSLLPVLTGKAEKSKDYIYCWYERNGIREKASQHVRDARFKLYAGKKGFFDTHEDLLEKSPIPVDQIPEQLRPTYARLKEALEKHVAVTAEADARQNTKRNGGEKKAKAK